MSKFVGILCFIAFVSAYPMIRGLFIEETQAKTPIVITHKVQKEIKVMVIDTGIGLHKDLLGIVQYEVNSDHYNDTLGHGTHVAGIVVYGNKLKSYTSPGSMVLDKSDKLCSQIKIYSCKYWTESGKDTVTNTEKCLKKAVDEKFDYINYSSGGPDFSDVEYELYRQFLYQGGSAFVAAGNGFNDLREKSYYPASYAFEDGFTSKQKSEFVNGIKRYDPLKLYVVQNLSETGDYVASSNRHPLALSAVGENVLSTLPGHKYGIVTGTSQATPALLHTILRQRCNSLN